MRVKNLSLIHILQKVKKDGLIPMVVTGSGQLSLLERLEHNYPGMFRKELMVTAVSYTHLDVYKRQIDCSEHGGGQNGTGT